MGRDIKRWWGISLAAARVFSGLGRLASCFLGIQKLLEFVSAFKV
jgi:hypothetical protein